jgi:SAM-dependent methyltransferase
MDLRPYGLSTKQVERAFEVLDYQPFIISDELQTGVGYSWLHSLDARVAPALKFRKAEWNNEWDKITESNRRLRVMYEDFIAEIARRYPGGSLFDVACNNGYFPVRAQMMGMRHCVGSDLGGQHAASIKFLNDSVGTNAKFIHAPYDPIARSAPISQKFDVVVAAAIMCHLPDPLNFLAFLGSISKEAIFFWGQMVDTDALTIAYNPPHPNLGGKQSFPYGFNDNTRISRGLFELSTRLMGFREVIEFPYRPHWPFGPHDAGDLENEIKTGSSHLALLAVR